MQNGNTQEEEVFSEAWQKVLAGDSIESVLAAYPEHAAGLEPMLRLTTGIRSLPQPSLSAESLVQLQRRVQAAVHDRDGNVTPLPAALGHARNNVVVLPPRHRSWRDRLFPPRPTLRIGVGALLVLVFGVMAVVVISSLTGQPNARQPLESYSGVITEMTASGWMVGDTQVLVDSTTEIHGKPEVGASMICIGQHLGNEQMRALEVWIGSAPGAPTGVPTHDEDESLAPGGAVYRTA